MHAQEPKRSGAEVPGKDSFTVIIIGAGATGLLIAQGLKQANIDFRIFERDDPTNTTRRPRDWSMGLHWGREYISSMLPQDIQDDLHMISTDPHSELLSQDDYRWALSSHQMKTFPLVNGKTGDIITEVKASTSRRASRQKTKNLFSRGLNIEYGKRLEHLEEDDSKVTCHFDDGSAAVGNAVIGADSVRSSVREHLLPPEKNRLETLPTVMYNFTQQFSADQANFLRSQYHPVFKYAMHPDSHTAFILTLLDVPDPNDPTSWTFQLMIDQWGHSEHLPTSAERLAHFRHLTSQYCEPWRSAGQWVKEDTFIPADRPQHMPSLAAWDNHGGRITLAGDAAHPMAPYRGQGLNNGLRDATQYVMAIRSVVYEGKDLRQTIDEYDRELVERGRKEIELSAYQGMCSHDYEKLLDSPLMNHGMNRIEQQPSGEAQAQRVSAVAS